MDSESKEKACSEDHGTKDRLAAKERSVGKKMSVTRDAKEVNSHPDAEESNSRLSDMG